MDTKAYTASDLKVDEGERAVTAYISTTAVDRDNEVLLPTGANLRDYKKNPIVLYGHDAYSLPVGKATAITQDDKGIKAKAVFAKRPETYPADQDWLPDTILSLFQQGVLRAFSVGFLPTEARPATDKDVEKFGSNVRRVIAKWNLLEFSVVTIPSNPDAVAAAVSKSADALRKLYEPPPIRIPVRTINIKQHSHDPYEDLRVIQVAADPDYGEITKTVAIKRRGRVYMD